MTRWPIDRQPFPGLSHTRGTYCTSRVAKNGRASKKAYSRIYFHSLYTVSTVNYCNCVFVTTRHVTGTWRGDAPGGSGVFSSPPRTPHSTPTPWPALDPFRSRLLSTIAQQQQQVHTREAKRSEDGRPGIRGQRKTNEDGGWQAGTNEQTADGTTTGRARAGQDRTGQRRRGTTRIQSNPKISRARDARPGQDGTKGGRDRKEKEFFGKDTMYHIKNIRVLAFFLASQKSSIVTGLNLAVRSTSSRSPATPALSSSCAFSCAMRTTASRQTWWKIQDTARDLRVQSTSSPDKKPTQANVRRH